MKKRVITAAFVLLFFCVLSPLTAYNLHMILSGQDSFCSIDPAAVLMGLGIPQVLKLTLLGIAVSALAVVWMLVSHSYIKYRNGMREIVPGLSTPDPAGQGQYGTARWMEPNEICDVFSVVTVDKQAPLLQELMARGYDDLEGGLDEQ